MPDYEPIQEENLKKEQAVPKNRYLSPRRRLAQKAGAVLLASSVIGSAIGIGSALLTGKPSEQDQTHRPAVAETINSEGAFAELLRKYPDAKVHLGGKMILNFVPGERSVLPNVRNSTFKQDSEYSNVITNIRDYVRINGQEVNFNERTSLEIDNFILAEGTDADNRLNPAAEGNWLAVLLTGPDGNSTWGFISKSNQTAPYWDLEESGNPTSLELITDSEQLSKLNKTTVVSGK
jgi:hypothetical protein